MTPALALEQLMLHPRYGELVDHVRRHAAVALVDQGDAAATEAHALLSAVAVNLCDDDARPTAAADLPGWLRLGVIDTLVQWTTGRASTCRHSPHPGRPAPVLAAAWKPSLVVCSRCVHLTALPVSSARDRTCDACGRVCAGLEHGDGIHPGMVQLGPLIYQYGTCGDCRPSITTDSGPLSATLPAEQDTPRGTGSARRTKPRSRRGTNRSRGHRKD